jgi:hypothetical protein
MRKLAIVLFLALASVRPLLAQYELNTVNYSPESGQDTLTTHNGSVTVGVYGFCIPPESPSIDFSVFAVNCYPYTAYISATGGENYTVDAITASGWAARTDTWQTLWYGDKMVYCDPETPPDEYIPSSTTCASGCG